MDVGSCN